MTVMTLHSPSPSPSIAIAIATMLVIMFYVAIASALLVVSLTIGYRMFREAQRTSPPLSGWVVVTGTSSGIGLATAASLVTSQNTRVCAMVRKASDADALAAVVGEEVFSSSVLVVVADVTDPDSLHAAAKALAAESGPHGARPGPVWGLVACAGISVLGSVAETPISDWQRQIDVNLLGTIRTVQAFLPLVRASPPDVPKRIVVVGSLFGVLAEYPGWGIYAASKFALEAVVRTLRAELWREAIDVVMVNPAGIATPFLQKLGNDIGSSPSSSSSSSSSPSPSVPGPPHITASLANFAAHTSAGSPSDVARTLSRALFSSSPYTYYPVGPQAGMIYASSSLLPNPILHLVARSGIPQALLFHLNNLFSRSK